MEYLGFGSLVLKWHVQKVLILGFESYEVGFVYLHYSNFDKGPKGGIFGVIHMENIRRIESVAELLGNILWS